MRQRKVLEVKKVYALTKDLRLMVLLDFEALSRVSRSETLLKNGQNILGHHCLCGGFWRGHSWPKGLPFIGALLSRAVLTPTFKAVAAAW